MGCIIRRQLSLTDLIKHARSISSWGRYQALGVVTPFIETCPKKGYTSAAAMRSYAEGMRRDIGTGYCHQNGMAIMFLSPDRQRSGMSKRCTET
jgi:hypothetical protein